MSTAAGGALDVDTPRVPDGPQTFSLAVTDAAGNTEVVTSPTVIVENHGPLPPVDLGATAEDVDAIAITWRNPSGAPATITRAMAQVCQATCPPARSVVASGVARVAVPGPGLYSVRPWLLDAVARGGPHNAALASVRIAAPAAAPPPQQTTPPRTRIAAVLRGRRLLVAGTIARTGRVRVGWQALRTGRLLGRGSRIVTIRDGEIETAFDLPARVRTRAGTVRVAIRSGSRIVAQARARRG